MEIFLWGRTLSCFTGKSIILVWSKAKYGELGLMIFYWKLVFWRNVWKIDSSKKKVWNNPNKGVFWGPQKRDYLAKTEVHWEGWRMIDIIFEQQLFRASIWETLLSHLPGYFYKGWRLVIKCIEDFQLREIVQQSMQGLVKWIQRV